MDALQIITLVTAIWGAVTGTGALVWGIWQFVLAGPRIRAEIEQGRLGIGAGFVSGGPAWSMSDPRFPIPVVLIRTRNKGRSPVDVTAVGVELSGREKLVFRDFSYLGNSPPLPHRVEPGSSAYWLLEFDGIRAAVVASMEVLGGGQDAGAIVELGTGKVVRSKARLEIPVGP